MGSIFNIFGKYIITTVVGSLPVQDVTKDLKTKVRDAVNSQVDVGINLISTGQVSMYGKNMIEPYLETMANIDFKEKLGQLVPEIAAKKTLKLAENYKSTEAIEEIRIAVAELKRLKAENTLLKAAVTGPNTILHEIPPFGLGNYKSKDEILNDISNVLIFVVNTMIEAGADVIQIDEPILSRDQYQNIKDFIRFIEVIANAVKSCKCVALHVCGEISRELFLALCRLRNIDILDFEFHLYPNNFNNILPADLDTAARYESPKNLAVGVVGSVTGTIESVESTKRLMRKAIRYYGAERVCFDPDCGLRSFKPGVAQAKLKTLVQASEELKRELNLY